MSVWLAAVVALAVAYLLGATPTGYLAGRLLKGVDIREHGSRSTGATNAIRTLGLGIGLLVLLVDLLKGLAAVLFARWLFASPLVVPDATEVPQGWAPWVVCGAGLAVVLGHARSIWLGFTGGKSAAAGLGVLLAMSWPVGLGAAAVVGVVLASTRIMSLGSMLGALAAAVLVFVRPEPWPYRLLVLVGAAAVIGLHHANIGRLLSGKEPRIGQPVA